MNNSCLANKLPSVFKKNEEQAFSNAAPSLR